MVISRSLVVGLIERRLGALRAVKAACLLSSALCLPGWSAHGKIVPSSKTWTLADIVRVPEIRGVAISNDGAKAVYILRRADLVENRQVYEMYLVTLATGKAHRIYSGHWVSNLTAIPNSVDWSVLADVGNGVQLYRICGDGDIHLIASADQTVMVGMSDDAVGTSLEDAPQRVGVASYGWSADGKNLWYTTVGTSTDNGARPVNEEMQLRQVYGISRRSLVELHVAWGDRSPVVVGRYDGGLIGPAYAADVQWAASSRTLDYIVRQAVLAGRLSEAAFALDEGASVPHQIDYKSAVDSGGAVGPYGGRLATHGWGTQRHLIEAGPGGASHDYGAVSFTTDSAFASGAWLSKDGKLAVIGVRYPERHVRNGLVRITQAGVEEVRASGGLTDCSFTPIVAKAVCIRQSMVSPLELVSVDPARGAPRHIIDIAPEYTRIRPLHVEPRVWKSRFGHVVTGFVVFPRNYHPGLKYPAIVVTHGNDADERFANQDFQWEFPVQVWAERGYVVICVNNPPNSQSQELTAAYAQWNSGVGSLSPDEIQDQVWLDGVSGFESAVRDLADQGIVDESRVGIAGYSRGSQMVNVAMTQSKIFRVASSGEGGYLEPWGYSARSDLTVAYRQIYGGSPFDTAFAEHWKRLAPTFRAAQAAGPILQQISRPDAAKTEFYTALREAGIPTQITLYPGENTSAQETHLFHIPSNRLAAMAENIDWFDFWLLGKEAPDPSKADQYKRWRGIRSIPETVKPTS